MTPAGRLPLALDRALLLAALPECPTCGATTGEDCVRRVPYTAPRVDVHEERLADLRDEVELLAGLVLLERAAARQGRELGPEALTAIRAIACGATTPAGRRRARSELARLRRGVLG